MANPPQCASGLVCTPVPGSHLPFGDVGGTCEPAQNGGSNVAQEGQNCGGNIANPPQCASGLVCVPVPGHPGPFGDVGGICVQGNSGSNNGSNLAQQGDPCGGNTVYSPQCAPGLVCTPIPGHGPVGDVGGTCQPVVCTMERKLCLDGSSVGRNASNYCEFNPCPTSVPCNNQTGNGNGVGVVCADDVRQCPDGSWVARDPSRNCAFASCSSNGNN